MATVFTHPVPVLALGMGLGTGCISGRLFVLALVCTVLPDIDVPLLNSGLVGKGLLLGHRGLTHSLVFALAVGVVAALLHRVVHSSWKKAFWVCFLAVLSHIALDMLTTGGRFGLALLAPWDASRYTLPWAPIKISPFAAGFFTRRGLEVLLCELRMVWLPGFGLWALLLLWRSLQKRGSRLSTVCAQSE